MQTRQQLQATHRRGLHVWQAHTSSSQEAPVVSKFKLLAGQASVATCGQRTVCVTSPCKAPHDALPDPSKEVWVSTRYWQGRHHGCSYSSLLTKPRHPPE